MDLELEADARTSRLDEVIAEYLDDSRLGSPPKPEEWLARHPEMAAELSAFLNDKARFDGLAGAVHASPAKAGARPPALPRVGSYEILGELGRGGMGVVYKARQAGLNRVVALKMVLEGAHQGGDTLARFQAEAEAVARLKHPNIVQIYEIGQADGLPFFSLEFVDGGTLSQRIAGQPQPTRQSAAIVETLAHAMEYAHGQGIVHRDLKPANVLMTAQGMPKITDFGLAKHVERSDGATRTGAILGTPSYLAPEQAAGKKAVGPAADVYALGVILYEMLTGRPPFRGDTPMETMLQVMSDEPPPPARVNPTVPRDLETICLKCLGKDPAKRYATAASLAEDLRRFRGGESIQARPAGVPERAWRWCRRRPAVASLLALTLILFVGGFAGIVDQWLRARASAIRAEAASLRSEASRLEAQGERDRADKLRQEAQRERDRAEQNFKQARHIVDDIAGRLNGDPGWHLPQVRKLRMEYEHVVLDYYREFARQHDRDPELDTSVAHAYFQIGLASQELGLIADAEKALQTARSLFKDLLRRDPKSVATRHVLAEAALVLAQAQHHGGNLDDAFRSYAEAEVLLNALQQERPADATIQHDVLQVYVGIGLLHVATNQHEKAMQAFRAGKAYLTRMAGPRPSTRQARTLAIFCVNCGRSAAELKRLPEAKKEYLEAVGLFKTVYNDQGMQDPNITSEWMMLQSNMAGIATLEGHHREAAEMLSACRSNCELLLKDYPGIPKFQANLAEVDRELAWARVNLNRPDDALPLLKESRNIRENLIKGGVDVLRHQEALADAWLLTGCAQHILGQHAEGQKAFAEALKLYRQLALAHPGNPNYQRRATAVEAEARRSTTQP